MGKMSHWNVLVEKTSDAFLTEFGKMKEQELNWKPAPQRWSIAQIMDHIIITNESYFPIFERIKDGNYKTPGMGKIPFIPALMGKMVLKAVRPETKRKSKTFGNWEPVQSTMPMDIVDKFSRHQKELMMHIKSMEDYIGRNIIVNSPLSNYIVYSLEDAIEILVVHEVRHLNQAREVLQLMKQVV
jgi:hypothetical protein